MEKFLGHQIIFIYSTLINNTFLISTMVHQLTFSPVVEVSVVLYLHQHLEISDLKLFTNLIGLYGYPIVVLICLFLITNDIECLIKPTKDLNAYMHNS